MMIQKTQMIDAIRAYRTMDVSDVELDFMDNMALIHGRMRGYEVTYAINAHGSIGNYTAKMNIEDIINQKENIDIELNLDKIQFGKMNIDPDNEDTYEDESHMSYLAAGYVKKDELVSVMYDVAMRTNTMDMRLIGDKLAIKGAFCNKTSAKLIDYNPHLITKKKLGGKLNDIIPILYILKKVPDDIIGILFYGNKISIETRHIMIVRSF